MAVPEAISEFVKKLNDTTDRLKASGYMSPQAPMFVGVGFSCRNCDWYRYSGRAPSPSGAMREFGDCSQPTVKSVVEYNACCDKFTFDGVST